MLLRLFLTVGLLLTLLACLPNICRFPMQEREIRAVLAIRAIREAEENYRLCYRRFGTMAELRSAGFVGHDPEGYELSVVAGNDRYCLEAWPAVFERTGRRSFFSDESLPPRVWESYTAQFDFSRARALE